MTDLFNIDEDVSTGIQIGRAKLTHLDTWVEDRLNDAHRLQEWAKYRDLRDRIAHERLEDIFVELDDRKFTLEEAKNAFLRRFYFCWLDWVRDGEPQLRRFASIDHERLIGNFRELDKFSVNKCRNRVREKLLNNLSRPSDLALNVPDSSELGTLTREINKKRSHLSLRKLFGKIPTILPRLKPCLMMSPLAVSTFLDSPEFAFDLVIFDEASQVKPHDAVCAIYRGKQLVVAGDQKQLPPTDFFERAAADDDLTSEDEETEETTADFESILDVCCSIGLPRRRLRWHYRSRREPLIAFSNRKFYDNELVTFPGANDEAQNPAVRRVFVADGQWISGRNGGFNRVEARRTAELIMDHFRSFPHLSLGVIAFGVKQRDAIEDELNRLRIINPRLENFFAKTAKEPFFLKNLEHVQGDERDVIFLSVGYGPDENRRTAMRFGPLNKEGGERRLNVAVTRARNGMTVVTSMRSHDIDLSRTKAIGAEMLRAYLDFAERGVEALRSEIQSVDEQNFESPFERQVAEALKKCGMEVRSQVGCGGFRIDLALVDPEKPGRFLLGIECDGATYHRSATARDRDRLRQQVLEDLGWTIVRIWSTDWVKNPSSQIEKVLAAYERRRAEPSPEISPTPAPAPAPAPPEELPIEVETFPQRTSNPSEKKYQNIDEVPDVVIDKLLILSLQQNGATVREDLTRSIARSLGFQRTGNKIVVKIEERIRRLAKEGKILRTEDDLLRIHPNLGLMHA